MGHLFLIVIRIFLRTIQLVVDYFIHIHVNNVENVDYMLFYHNKLTTTKRRIFLLFLWIMWKSW
ncbi:hypothetical protein AF2641_01625 [Anoxybacillus flavithermus]|nr:hypothetical protein AF2641_01625 [Anoxybacillus flavithermus]